MADPDVQLKEINKLDPVQSLKKESFIPVDQKVNGVYKAQKTSIEQMLALSSLTHGTQLRFAFSPLIAFPAAEGELRFNQTDPIDITKLSINHKNSLGIDVQEIANTIKNCLLEFKSANLNFYAIANCNKATASSTATEIEASIVTSSGNFPAFEEIALIIHPKQTDPLPFELPNETNVTPDLKVSNSFIYTPTADFTLKIPVNAKLGSKWRMKIQGGYTMTLDAGYQSTTNGITRSSNNAEYDILSFDCYKVDATEDAKVTAWLEAGPFTG